MKKVLLITLFSFNITLLFSNMNSYTYLVNEKIKVIVIETITEEKIDTVYINKNEQVTIIYETKNKLILNYKNTLYLADVVFKSKLSQLIIPPTKGGFWRSLWKGIWGEAQVPFEPKYGFLEPEKPIDEKLEIKPEILNRITITQIKDEPIITPSSFKGLTEDELRSLMSSLLNTHSKEELKLLFKIGE